MTLLSRCSLVALSLAIAPTVAAQSSDPEPLPEAIAEGDRAPESYSLANGVDTGTATIGETEIRARAPGSGDVNQLLKILPTAQFRRIEGSATREDIQDLRPADISISGGRIYDNLFTIDGIDANSRLDATEDNPQSLTEPAGNKAQSLWIDANLVGEIIVRDSNVSAEYGRFTGGTVDIRTRDPKREWGAFLDVNYTDQNLVDFTISKRSIDALGTNPLPDEPLYRKWRIGGGIDIPLTDRGGLLLAASRSRADVTYYRNPNYGSIAYVQDSVSDNFLARGSFDLGPALTLSGQISYTPYESESSAATALDNTVVSKGGGTAAKLELASNGAQRWNLVATYSHSNSGREAPPNNYSLPSSSTNGGTCSNSNCTSGGFGRLDQTQDNYGLRAKFAKDVGPGELRGGIDYQHIDAIRERPETNRAYLGGISGTNILCADGDSLLCTSGEYALARYLEYRAYRADVSLDSLSAWGEYDAKLGKVDVRAGLRYDYESFLGNHNVAPRLAATWHLPFDGWSLTGGLNRYYGRSMLAYAIREQYPDNFTYLRAPTIIAGERVYSDNWYLSSTSRSTSYADSNLKTPYSDELTAALTGRVLGGTVRLKGIIRQGKNEFARSIAERVTGTLENGNSTTYTLYTMTNDGESRYRGASLEWLRSVGKHSLAINVNYSKSKTSNADYFLTRDDILNESLVVLFNGELIDATELLDRNQRLEFASPFIVNASWTALWFDDRVTTNLNLRYRDGFTQIGDTGVNQVVDGVRYDVYDIVRYRSTINVDLNAQVDVVRSRLGTLTADIRASNILNRIASKDVANTTQPYQFGRAFWVGLKYKF